MKGREEGCPFLRFGGCSTDSWAPFSFVVKMLLLIYGAGRALPKGRGEGEADPEGDTKDGAEALPCSRGLK